MKEVTINGKKVVVKPVDFNAICELSDLGFDFESGRAKTFTTLRAVVAYNLGVSAEEAGKEIEQHVVGGGSFEDIIPLVEAVTESDFFQALGKK